MMKANAYELISVYYGDIIQESQAQALADRIKETFEGCDVELQFGGQPIYALYCFPQNKIIICIEKI